MTASHVLPGAEPKSGLGKRGKFSQNSLECGIGGWKRFLTPSPGGVGETVSNILVSPLRLYPSEWPAAARGAGFDPRVLRPIVAEEFSQGGSAGTRQVPLVSHGRGEALFDQ